MWALLHSKTNQSINSWISNGAFLCVFLGAIFSAPLAWLSKMSPAWFGTLNWPQAILFGIAESLAIAFVLAVGLLIGTTAYRRLRPSPQSPPSTDAEAALVPSHHSQMTALREEFAAHKAHMEKCYSDADRVRLEGQDTLGRKIEAIGVDIMKLAKLQDDNRARASGSLRALGDREYLSRLKTEILQAVSDMYDRLRGGATYDAQAWGSWESCHAHWNGRLEDWLNRATFYAVGVKQRVLTVDDRDYGGQWATLDSQFPGSEEVRRFKKFRIIHRQWEIVVPDVESGMEFVAFTGITDLEVRHGRPPG
jgi:hypothetical protein